MRKINNFLFNHSGLFQKIVFIRDQKRINANQLDYSQIRNHWMESNTKVHADCSDESISRMAKYIAETAKFSNCDVVLDVGCGDGLIDSKINNVDSILGFDFSESKNAEAKKLNNHVKYWVQSFLSPIVIEDCQHPNKIFSFSVLQYCKESDLYSFFNNQIMALDKGNGTIYAMDVPDLDKAYKYYSNIYTKLSPEYINKNRNLLISIWGDGSYWTDIRKVKDILEGFSEVKNVNIIDGMSNYRSTIVIECKKETK